MVCMYEICIYIYINPGCTGNFFPVGPVQKLKISGAEKFQKIIPMGVARSGDRKTIVGARKTIPEA